MATRGGGHNASGKRVRTAAPKRASKKGAKPKRTALVHYHELGGAAGAGKGKYRPSAPKKKG